MVEPETPEHTNVRPLPEGVIYAGLIRNGKSAIHTALLLASLDATESKPASGGEQQ